MLKLRLDTITRKEDEGNKMLKLRLDTITRKEDGGWVIHVMVYNDTEPNVVLARFHTAVETLSKVDIQNAITNRLTPKLVQWEQKEAKKVLASALIQSKLDQVII